MMRFPKSAVFLMIMVIVLQYSNAVAQRNITFSGYQWVVRNGSGGPGPNLWSDSDSSVWLDKSGYLHLKIRKTGNNWYCSEVYLISSLGYGTYKFVVESDLARFDKNIVVGLFLYEDDTKEIDIEFARWGNSLTIPGWYTVQPPPYTAANQYSFDIDTGITVSTHLFDWLPDRTYFKSINGIEEVVPPNNNLLAEWTYTGNPQPTVGNELLHINFWLFQGLQPSDKKEAEIIIRKFEFKPANSVDEESANLLKISPNPAKNIIRIELPEASTFHAEIFNSAGIISNAFHFSGNNYDHDISLLPPGVYVIKIAGEVKTFSKKFIISKH